MNDLEGKIIVVTGGNGLIGSSIINYLKECGAICINADLNCSDDLENGNAFCDVTDEESVVEVLSNVVARYNRIDGFVNSAYPRTSDWGANFENIMPESWMMNVNIQMNSVFICCQAVLKIMKRQGFGSVVNISSIYGVVAPDFLVYEGTNMTMPAAYSAIKGGIINFTRYLASYYGPDGVRCNCVSPGGIFDNQNEKFVTRYEQKTPMRRMGKPEDISPAVAFLISNSAGYITGQNIIVDGGWTTI